MLSHFSPIQLFATLWTIASQVPLSRGFCRQECWSRVPCPPPGDLPHPRIESTSLTSPALACRCFTTSTSWEVLYAEFIIQNARLDESQTEIKIARRNINNLKYADDTTLMAESKEELKRLLDEGVEESENASLKLNIQKLKS